jgi:hypothetical protein
MCDCPRQQQPACGLHLEAVTKIFTDVASCGMLLLSSPLLLLLLLSGLPPLGPLPVCVRCHGGSSEGVVPERCVACHIHR